MSAENIASIYIEAVLSTRKLKEDIKALEKSKISIDVDVDDKELTALNKHLDKKVSHYAQVRNNFKNNPLEVFVSDSQLTNLNKVLDSVTGNRKIQIELAPDNTGFSELEKESLKIQNLLRGQILSGIITAPFSSMAAGFFENIGGTFGRQISQGISKNLQKNLGFNLTDYTDQTINNVVKNYQTSTGSAPKSSATNPNSTASPSNTAFLTGMTVNPAQEQAEVKAAMTNAQKINNIIRAILNKNVATSANQTLSSISSELEKTNTQKPQTPTVLNIPLSLPTVEKEKEEVLKNAVKVQKVNSAVQESISKNVTKSIDKSLELIKLEIVKPDANINIAKNQFANITSRLSEAYKSLKVEIEKGNLEIAKYYATSINESASRARAEIEAIQANLKASGVPNQFGSELATLVGSTKGVIEARYAKPSRQKLEQINQVEKVGEFVDVGKQVIAGTVQGLKSTSPLVKESNEVAFIILNSMRKTLGIQSPSKKAKEVMMYVIEGLIEGGKAGIGSVQNASNEVGKAVLKGIIKATDGSVYEAAKNQIFNLDTALSSGQAKIYPTVKKFFSSVDAAMSQGNIYPGFKNILSSVDSALSANNSKSAQALYNKLFGAKASNTNPTTSTQTLTNPISQGLNFIYNGFNSLVGNISNLVGTAKQKVISILNLSNTANTAASANTTINSNTQTTANNQGSSPNSNNQGFGSFRTPSQNVQFNPNTVKTKKTLTFGTVEFFDNLYDEFANQFVKLVGKSGTKQGSHSNRQLSREVGAMAFSVAGFMAPMQTAMGLITPLLSNAIPITIVSNLVNGLISPVVARINSALKSISPIQERLTVLAGSSEGGQAEMSYLQGVGQKYNVGIQGGADAYSKLAFAAKGTKLEGEGVKELYEGIAASIRTMNLSTGESSLVFQAYTQILAKGKLSMEELRQQLGEKFPQAMSIFAKAMGVSVPELQSLIGKGAILSEDILPKVARVLKSEFGDSKIGDSFASAMVKMENAAFNLNVKLVETFGGVITGISRLGSGLLEFFTSNFDKISKLGIALLAGMTVQVSVGIQALMGLPVVAKHLTSIQNFLFSTLKKTTSMLFPFVAGSFMDVFDDFFGVENSMIDNMMKGITSGIQGVLGVVDSINIDMGGKGFMEATFNQKNLGMIESITQAISGMFKLIPSGAVEMLALVMMFEQSKVLMAMLLQPQWEMFSKAIGQIGFAFKNAALNSTNFKDTLKTVLPIATESIKGLIGASKEMFLAYAIMSLARSDFGNPIAESFKKAADKIVGNIGEIKNAIQNLKTTSEKPIEPKLILPSKGLELNPGKVLGLSNDSFKSDDLISLNARTDAKNKNFLTRVLSGQEFDDAGFSFNAEDAKKRKAEADKLGVGDYFSAKDYNPTLAQDQLLKNAKQQSDFVKALDAELRSVNLTPDTVKSFASQPQINKALIEVQEIDKKIKELSDKRVDISLINTSESKVQLRELDGQIKDLVKQRQPKSKIFDEMFGNLEDSKKQLDDVTKSIESSDIPNKAKKALISALEPQKKAIDETVEYLKNAGIYKLAKPLEEIWTSVVARLSDAELAFDRLKDKTKIINLNEQTAIFNTAQTPGAQRFSIARQNVSSLQTDQDALKIQAAFRERALRDLLSISGVETNEARRGEVTKLREQVTKDKISLAESQLAIAKAKADLLQQLRDQTKQVNEYYQGITRQVQEANLEFQKQINNIKSNNAATRIRQAIGDSEDSFLNTFVENLIGQIESIKEVSNSKLDLQTKNLQSSFQLEDSFKTGLELKKSLPDIPAIPVELDLTQVASDENVQKLNAEFGQTNDLIGQLNQGSSSLDSLIQQNQGSTSSLVEEFSKTLSESEKTGETINSNIQATSEWQSSLSLITGESSTIFDKFNGMFGLLNQISATTSSWLQQLSTGAAALGNLAGNVASNFAQTGFGQGLQTIGNAIMGNGSGIGFVSPIKGKTIDELLKYTPSQAQGFYGKRDGGTRQHSKVDFDSRVGGGQGAEILAAISGMAKFRQITGTSGGVDISGKDSKGNDITVVYNHLALPELKQFFGGSNTKQVNAGQRLSTVTMDSLSTGAHLDFGIKVNGKYVDPQKWMATEGKALTMMQQQVQNAPANNAVSFSNAKIDAASVARKNSLQSLVVATTSGQVLSSYKGNENPASPASTIKLLIGDLATDKLNPNQQITVNKNAVAEYEDKFKAGQSYSVSTLLTEMLKNSNNTAANALIQGLGGFGAVNSMAKAKGYNNSSINNYLSATQGNSTGVSNRITANDATKAMVDLLNDSSAGGQIASSALRQTRNFKYQGEAGGKIGNNSKVLGNVGIVNINGQEYLVTAYANIDGNKDANRKIITNATNEITKSLGNISNQQTSNLVKSSSQMPVQSSGGISQGGNKLTQAEYNKLTPLGKKLYQYQQDPRVLAFGDVVARAEGTDFRSNSKNFGYSMMIGGEHDTDFSRHPFAGNSGTGSRVRSPFRVSKGLASTASGRYQMMDFNYSQAMAKKMNPGWDSDLKKIFQGDNPGSFSPGVQDLYFIASLQSRGVLDEVLAGNFQGALSNPNIANHYASLQKGGGRSAYKGQGTPEGQLKNTIPFAQQRLQARLQGRSSQVMTPAQMQGTVNQGMLLQQGSINQGVMVNQQQAEADQARQQQQQLKIQENQLNNLRKNIESNKDLQLSTTRRTEDLKLNIDPNKDFKQQLDEATNKIKREYADIERELTRKAEDLRRSLEKSKTLLASGEVTGENRTILQQKIASDEKTLSTVTKALDDTQKLRSEALSKLAENMNFEEKQRQDKIDFESSGLSLDNLKAKLEALKALQSTNPLSPEILNIPDLERVIQLRDEELNLNRQLADLDGRRFKKELTTEQYNLQAELLKKNSIQKRDNINATYELAKAEQALKVNATQLEIRSKGLELDFAIKQEKIKAVQLSKKYNPLADVDNKELTIGNELQVQQLALETEKSIQSIQEFARSMGLSKEATDSLINSVLELNDIKLDNITKEFNDSLGESRIKQLEDINSRENRIADFNNTRAFSLEQMKIDRIKSTGGNEFAANARSRTLGKTQEMIRYEKEKREVEIEVLRMRQSGIEVDDTWLTKTREDMEAIHGLNLENINMQFKTFGQTLNEIGNQSIKGLSNGLTDLIMGTKSLNNVLDDFFGNILNQVLNAGFQSLLGGLFGGGGGGGLLGGIFGGLFYDGGVVPNYAKGKPAKNISDAMRREAMQSGRKPQLAVVHENELIIPASRAEKLSSLGLTPEMLLGKVNNYADGGVVGRAARGVPTTPSNQPQTINVEYTKINDVEYVTINQFQQGIKTAIEQGGSLGEKRVQSKMANSVAFRGSVGMR